MVQTVKRNRRLSKAGGFKMIRQILVLKSFSILLLLLSLVCSSCSNFMFLPIGKKYDIEKVKVKLSDSIFILPIAYKNDYNLYPPGKYKERNVTRYENRGRHIRESIDNIQHLSDSILRGKGYMPVIIEEMIWDTDDTLVNSKEVEYLVKLISRNENYNDQLRHVINRVERKVPPKKLYLLIYNECKWRERLLADRVDPKYLSYFFLIQERQVIYFKGLKRKVSAKKTKKLERVMYNKLLNDVAGK